LDELKAGGRNDSAFFVAGQEINPTEFFGKGWILLNQTNPYDLRLWIVN
jgi:hypothetical protein